MGDYFSLMSTQFGIPTWALSIVILWTLTWKLLALWKSARKGSIAWFIILAVLNTVGILPILYIFIFSKINWEKMKKMPAKKKVAKKTAKRKRK